MRTITSSILAFAFASTLHAHPGRTDARGGHVDRSTGVYHFHSGGTVAPRVAPAATLPQNQGKPMSRPRRLPEVSSFKAEIPERNESEPQKVFELAEAKVHLMSSKHRTEEKLDSIAVQVGAHVVRFYERSGALWVATATKQGYDYEITIHSYDHRRTRIWTSLDGKTKILAEYGGKTEKDQVRLKRLDTRTDIRVPLAKLSVSDQAFVANHDVN